MKHSASKLTDALGISEEEFSECMNVCQFACNKNKLSQHLEEIMKSYDLDIKDKKLTLALLTAYVTGHVSIAKIALISVTGGAPDVTN